MHKELLTATPRIVVLIVEDFDDAREMYEDYLRFAGLTVIGARDGAEGVRLAIEHLPDVIVMDAGLPKLTGWEATAMIRSNLDTQSLKILMLTGHVFQDSERKAREAGVDLFVAKPCLPDVLHAHILALARRGAAGGGEPMTFTEKRQQTGERRAKMSRRDPGRPERRKSGL
jgi:two-component system, cell cycle response regulator DivK